MLDQAFEVLAETTIAAQPGKGAFDDSATRQQDKSLASAWSQRDFVLDVARIFDPEGKLVAIITAVGQDLLQALPERIRPSGQSHQNSFDPL
jgi:hypothetical protein